MDQAGIVVMAMAGLWIAYLVPHRLQYRQQLLESRTDDRFSARLRVLCVAGAAAPGGPVVRQVAVQPRRVLLHSSGRGSSSGGGGGMDRPHWTADRRGADVARRTAADHAQRGAYLARRAAAARRRAVLTAVLLVAVVAGWAAVALAGAAILLALVPTLLLLTTLVLGRRAAVAGARADARWAAGHPGARTDGVLAGRPPAGVLTHGTTMHGVVGRAVHPSESTTEIIARVPSGDPVRPSGDEATGAPAEPDAGEQPSAAEAPAAEPAVAPPGGATPWAPVPVPPPAYTLKPAARRPEPAALVLDQPADAAAHAGVAGDGTATTVDGAGQDGSRPGSDAASTGEPVGAPEGAADDGPGASASDGSSGPSTLSGGLDLDAILARRRASGE